MPQRTPTTSPAPRRSTRSASPGRSPKRANRVIERSTAFVDPDTRHDMIAKAAYYRAAGRGFAPGNDLEDWLIAEQEIDARLLT
ncbi:MAG: DUF2934 domain-containing protein [Steroidobacteraceae bacterium]